MECGEAAVTVRLCQPAVERDAETRDAVFELRQSFSDRDARAEFGGDAAFEETASVGTGL